MGSGISAGALIAYEAIDVARRDPDTLRTVLSWGPVFVIAVIVLFMVDRNFGQIIAIGKENVQAQQKMADAMNEIADKDDRQAEELRRLTSYNAVQSERIMKRMDRQDYWLAQIAEVTKIRLRPEPTDSVLGSERAKGASA